MATRDEYLTALMMAHEAGDVDNARILAQKIDRMDRDADALDVESEGTIADSLGRGVFMGWSDELSGVLGAVANEGAQLFGEGVNEDFGDVYRGIRDEAREAEANFRERNPKTAMAAEIAGGFAGGGLAGSAAGAGRVATGLGKWGRYVGAGAGTGALAGAGHSTGDAWDSTLAGIKGGVMGGAVGAALPAVGGLFKPVGEAVMNAAGKKLGKDWGTKIAHAKLAQAMADDEITPMQLVTKMRRHSQFTAADAGGENVRGLARAAASFPGRAKNIAERTLSGRAQESGTRIKEAVKRHLSEEDDVFKMIDNISGEARALARPFYDDAYLTPIRMTDELADILKRPSIASAWKEAEKLYREETGQRLPQVFKVRGDQVVDMVDRPDMRMLDYLKRGLDDVIPRNDFGAVVGQVGNAINQTKQRLLRELDSQVPTYRLARKVWEGKHRYEEALDIGQKFISKDLDISLRHLKRMTGQEKMMFRVGVAKALRDKVNKMGDEWNIAKRLFGNPDMRAKLKAVFPDDASFKAFRRMMLQEARMAKTKEKVLGGSPTARIEGEKADLLVDPTAIASLMAGQPSAAIGSVARAVADRGVVPARDMGNELSSLLLDPNAASRILKSMPEGDATARAKQKVVTGLLGSVLPGLMGAQ